MSDPVLVKKTDKLQGSTSMNTDFARQQMIRQQVRAWDVFDGSVLDTLTNIPRENFVPEGYEALAFADTGIPLGNGEFMMTPTVEGRLLQALELTSNDKVLEIGTGSGYLTACLARLAGTVTSIDVRANFLDAARVRLADNETDNIELLEMDGTAELPKGSFDAIAVTGSIQTQDQRYIDALAPGGRLFVVVGDAPVMEAKLIVRTDGDELRSESLFETTLGPLKNAALPPQFRF